MWNSDEHDLYYQGTTTAELPLTMEVSYQFNGKRVDPHEIVGQSGSLMITIKLINHLETTETINGKTKYISTLFPCAIVTDLPTETFKDVKAEDGLILNESKNQIVALATVSGMSQMPVSYTHLDDPALADISFAGGGRRQSADDPAGGIVQS